MNPFELVGTNGHVPPPPLAVMVHREFDPIVTAMLVSVDAKPLAVAVTVIPVGPEVGLNTRETTVPVKVWEAVSDAAFPVIVTWFRKPLPEVKVNPFVAWSATNVHPLNDPPETVQVPPVSVIDVLVSVSSKVTNVSVEANPLPDAVTVIPVGPKVGLNARLVTVPLNV